MWILLGFLGARLESTETMYEKFIYTLCRNIFCSPVINKVYVTVLMYVHFEVIEQQPTYSALGRTTPACVVLSAWSTARTANCLTGCVPSPWQSKEVIFTSCF